jgi:RNA polymerase sigma-70 factor, ECF subfamily
MRMPCGSWKLSLHSTLPVTFGQLAGLLLCSSIVKTVNQIMTSMPPLTVGDGAGISAPGGAEKIIQRIQRAAGSNSVKARSMADADDDLVLQCRNGNAEAFEALVRKYQQMIHALTFRMTGSMPDAEDLAQETFIRAYKQIGSFGGKSKFATWLYSIAVHACLNWRRDEARRIRAQADCAQEMLVQGDESHSLNDAAREAQAALLKLPVKQRAAIILTVYDGLSHAEAGRVLKCSETTVSWRVFAAKQKLKKLLSRGTEHHLSCFTRHGEEPIEGALEHE